MNSPGGRLDFPEKFFFQTVIVECPTLPKTGEEVKNAGLAHSDCFNDRRCCRWDVPQDRLIRTICSQARYWEVEPDVSSPRPLSCGKPRSSTAVGTRREFQARHREDEPNDCTTAGRRARRHGPHALAAALYQNLVMTCRQCR